MTTCTYDTGSMYGCEPACSRPASVSFAYESFVVPLCAAHVGPMAGRVYPYTYETKPL